MFEVDTYRWIHLMGLIMTFCGFGLLIANFYLQDTAKRKARVFGFILHGTGLLFIFISGFAMLGKMGLMPEMPSWAIVKMLIWLLLGGLTVLIKRRSQSVILPLGLALVLGFTAAYFGVMHAH